MVLENQCKAQLKEIEEATYATFFLLISNIYWLIGLNQGTKLQLSLLSKLKFKFVQIAIFGALKLATIKSKKTGKIVLFVGSEMDFESLELVCSCSNH